MPNTVIDSLGSFQTSRFGTGEIGVISRVDLGGVAGEISRVNKTKNS